MYVFTLKNEFVNIYISSVHKIVFKGPQADIHSWEASPSPVASRRVGDGPLHAVSSGEGKWRPAAEDRLAHLLAHVSHSLRDFIDKVK